MMKAKFRIDYVGGSPALGDYELTYEANGEIAGGYSALELVEADQVGVLMLIESSPETIAAMKADERFVWIQDVS